MKKKYIIVGRSGLGGLDSVSAGRLVDLYGVNPAECIMTSEKYFVRNTIGYDIKNMQILRVREAGDYDKVVLI